MATRKPKTRNGGTWTEARFWAQIRSFLRRAFIYWQPSIRTLNASKRDYIGPNKRQKFEYQCAKCKKWWMRKEVQVDHIIPVGSLQSYDDLVDWLKRLTAEGDDAYQILCRQCHQLKTNEESRHR